MAPRTPTPRRSPASRRRSRPIPPGTEPQGARQASTVDGSATEPPPKRRRYIPGGAGGGGRFIEDDGTPVPVRSPSAPRRRAVPSSASRAPLPKRERSTRVRRTSFAAEAEDVRYSSAAAVAAAVVQNEGYKPREERGWEEFHPNLDIDATFMVYSAEEVDGTSGILAPTAPSAPTTPMSTTATPTTMNGVNLDLMPELAASLGLIPGTPPKRRVGRPPRDPLAFYVARVAEGLGTPRTPAVLPIYNQTPKEKLDLKRPQYRKTDRILLFESKKFGQARYVDKAMMNIGYQESDIFIRPENRLIKAGDSVVDDDVDQASVSARLTRGGEVPVSMGGVLGRVEYDMDEQDDMWLEAFNAERRRCDLEPITREVFEITITKIEKEWHALEKRIPKPNPKPPQTHRPRSSSAAAVNGEPSSGEDQDSRCAICDDGDCENTNAIVFCDGCDLAVHQECYGVPFIPEGQWLCRKCQLIGRGVPTCIFCPNTDGAFKQTNSSKWSHLLCAMWIPEVTLGNHTFMEPVMDVDKVPKTRWKLSCYICNQKMGACIQCGNKNCYQAFHVTCARRAKLFLKMKNSHGALAVLDGSMVLKAFCDKHCPPDYTDEHSVEQATRQAKRFYRKTMKGVIWADNQNAASALAASHLDAITEHPPDESQLTGAALAAAGGDKKKGQPAKPVWKLPSGAPIIPQAVFDVVEVSLQRFAFRKRKEFVAEACKFWTLKRESRRGAALLKRLQLQMETFSSVELTRRNFASMGPSGKARLARRIRFAERLLADLEQLKGLSEDVVRREESKLEASELERDFVNTCYFPVMTLLAPAVEKAIALDKNVFAGGLAKMKGRVEARSYVTTIDFARDLCDVIRGGINEWNSTTGAGQRARLVHSSPSKQTFGDARERRRLGKRILKAVQPQLEAALQAEAIATSKPLEDLTKELDVVLEACAELQQPSIIVSQEIAEDAGEEDTVMADAPALQITVAGEEDQAAPAGGSGTLDVPDVKDTAEDTDMVKVDENNGTEGHYANANLQSMAASVPTPESQKNAENATAGSSPAQDGIEGSATPPATTNGYVAGAGAGAIANNSAQTTPPTPPQSTGSLGNHQASDPPAAEGGIPWYLGSFEIVGTAAAEPGESADEEEGGARSPSEELTDLDDEELTELAIDVEKDTITASPSVSERKQRGSAGAGVDSSPVKGAARARTRSSARRR
ncbi:related to bromodomain and PHD finger-containing protein [Cephalotrichum gorgonifer]|uniref:Related to bromodomain and PHD finger-containing protein n=1 Tax=Cephalotrichum gorgonifer TaxID=2041049 RepID=A0AAE8SU04_9PEZI|nr:related to bromodomain and PHD finger-containing protein [Cephalotrichum gorgonifer]